MSNKKLLLEEEIRQLVNRLEALSAEQKLLTNKLKELQGRLKKERRLSQSGRVRNSISSTPISTAKHKFGHF